MNKASFDKNKTKIDRNALDLVLLSGGSCGCLKKEFVLIWLGFCDGCRSVR